MAARGTAFLFYGGTESSNPLSSRGEVKCEPDFRGEQPRAIRFRAASPPRAVSGRPAPISRIYTPIHMEFLCQYLEI